MQYIVLSYRLGRELEKGEVLSLDEEESDGTRVRVLKGLIANQSSMKIT